MPHAGHGTADSAPSSPPTQGDLWPLLAPRPDPNAGLRERWRLCLMLLAAISTEAIDEKALERWVRTPDATPADLFLALYYDRNDVKRLEQQALEFLADRSLIDAP